MAKVHLRTGGSNPRGHGSRCTVELGSGAFCDKVSIPEAPFPICMEHTAKLYRFLREKIETTAGETTLDRMADLDTGVKSRRDDAFDALFEARNRLRWERDEYRPEHARVYYVRVADMVKIGWTANLRQRMGSYPPGSTLLVTEAGGMDLELQRHGQFKHLLVAGDEWFRPDAELLDHINLLRLGQGSPALATA